MKELGVAEAQSKFIKLLSETVLVVDKKSNRKRAVILPYEEYSKLTEKLTKKKKK